MIGNRRYLHDTVYFFEQEYRTKINIHQIVQSDVNVDTGERKIVKNVYPVICCKLPVDTIRKFIQDIGYLAANKNFTYGGLNDYTSTKWLIRKARLPRGFITNLDFHIVENNKRYDETKIESLIENEVFIISGKFVESNTPFQIFEMSISQNINPYQMVQL